jgi:hypothetical protein
MNKAISNVRKNLKRNWSGQVKRVAPGLVLVGLMLILLTACGEVTTPTIPSIINATPTPALVRTTVASPPTVPTTTVPPQTTTAATAIPDPTIVETPRSSAAQDAQQAEMVIKSYFTAINDRNYQTAFTLLSDRYRQQVNSQADFAKGLSGALASVEVTNLDQASVVGSGEKWLVYKVQLLVKVGANPSNYNNGTNLEWIKLVKPGQVWQLDDFATSPLDK